MSERLFVRLADDPVYAPETTVPHGTMHELVMPAALEPFVASALAYDERLPPDLEVEERVLPDGALRVIVDLHAGAAPARVVGPTTRPTTLALRGHLMGISVTLHPGAATALFGVSAHELADQEVAWVDIAAPAHRGLPARLHDARNAADRPRQLVEGLLAMTPRGDRPRHRRALATTLVRCAAGASSVRAMAGDLGIGERRLQQLFRSLIGLPPLAVRRLARMHACLRALRRADRPTWADLAAEMGFYDQAHLVNEFKALCGETPRQFLRRTVSRSSNTPAATRG